MHDAHYVPTWVKLLPIFLASSGVILAVIAYVMVPSLPQTISRIFSPVHAFFFNKWYFDELYDAIFVKPSVKIGQMLFEKGDKQTIDAFGPDGISASVSNLSARLSRLQSGYVYHYAFAMMIGVVVLISWYYSGFGG